MNNADLYDLNDTLTRVIGDMNLGLDDDAMDDLLQDATYAVNDLIETAQRKASQ